jgi:hypothetical protein
MDNLDHSIFRLRDYKRAENVIKGFLDGLKGYLKHSIKENILKR